MQSWLLYLQLKKHLKLFVVLTIVLLLISSSWIGLMEYASHELKLHKSEIQTRLKEYVGYPVDFSSLEAKWSWGSMDILLNDIVVHEADQRTSLLKLKRLQVSVNVIRLLLKHDLSFNQVKLNGLKIVLGWNNDRLSLLGSAGEPLQPRAAIHTDELLAMLATQESVFIENSEIQLKGLESNITQWMNGKFYWKDIKRYIAVFEGQHQLKINDSVYSPPGNISLVIDPLTHFLSAKTEVGPVIGECQFAFEKKNGNEEISENNKATANINNDIDKDPVGKRDLSKNDSAKTDITQNVDNKNKEEIKLACRMSGENIDVGSIHQHIKLKNEDPDWIRWLVTALERGTVTQFSFEIAGFLSDLEWKGLVRYRDVEFRYDVDWPNISGAEGTVLIEQEKVEVEVLKGNIRDTPITAAKATIGPVGSKDISTFVAVEGLMTGPLEKGLEFLQNSPLKETIGSMMLPLNPRGLMDLQLFLKIPLGLSSQSVKVGGKISVNNAQVNIKELELPISQVAGTFLFTEKEVHSESVTAVVMDQPIVISVTPQKITTKGLVTAQCLQEKFKIPYFKYLKGQSEISVSYLNETNQWVIESNLKGISIDLPTPFAKSSEMERPTHIGIHASANKERRLSVNIKEVLSSNWILAEQKLHNPSPSGEGKHAIKNNHLSTEKNQIQETDILPKNNQYIIKQGHLALGSGNKADWSPAHAILISGEMNEVDVNAWWSFFKTLEDSSHTVPLQINLLSKNLDVFGLTFQNTQINYNTGKMGLTWALEGPMIKGNITLPTDKNKHLQFDFDFLKVTKNPHYQASEHSFLKGDERIAISFYSKNLEIDNTSFGEWWFRLNPKPYGYDIEDLNIITDITSMEAKGQYRLDAGKEVTLLQGNILSDNIGKTFTQWGFPSAIQEGRGRIQFDLTWPGNPLAFQLPLIEGNTDVRMRTGRILGVNTGIGKILGLLNLENLLKPRMPFMDAVQKGFAFDTLDGHFIFKDELVKTENLVIEGAVAKINMNGTANLKSKNINLNLVVIPKVSSTLPLAAGLATGNPAVGIGVWVLDKLTGSKISDISQRSYYVTGAWDAPILKESGHNKSGRRARRR
jgi:uncharacterized protein YhdP